MIESFTKKTFWLWNNAEKILVLLFFTTFPFNLRKVFLTPYSFPKGEFNEYLTLSLNWSDVLILSLLFIYTIKRILSQISKPTKKNFYLKNNKSLLSRAIHRITFLLRSNVLEFKFNIFSARKETFLLFFFLLWMIVSINWASFRLLAIYRLFIIFLIVTFFIIIQNLAKKGNIKAKSVYLGLLAGGIFQSLIGILQFILNHSLGLWFLGESILNPNLPGVAKIIVSGEKHIRAYGTFPHPNVLAGFLVLQIILLVSLLIKKHPRQRAYTSDNFSCETISSKIPAWVILVLLAVNTVCFFLTFSRSAFISLFFVSLALLLINLAHYRSRFWLILTIAAFVLLFQGLVFASRHPDNFLFSHQSLKERNLYLDVSQKTIREHPWTGIGLGQFVFQEIVSQTDWLGWQYQPVHNVYLLVTSELGIVGLTIFLLLILTFLTNYCKIKEATYLLTRKPFCIVILSFLFISLFDHYFWDIKSGIVLFAIPFLLARIQNIKLNQ
jgi:O-antigen ligase